MNYELIFYHSGKTAEIENHITELLKHLPLKLSGCCAALTPQELARHLGESLNRQDLVFIVGGLDGGVQSTDKILSAVLSGKNTGIKSNKLVDDDGNFAYMIRSPQQTIFLLPDDAEVIEKMFDGKIKEEIKRIYSLTEVREQETSVEEIARHLDRQLSDNQPAVSQTPSVVPDNREKSLFRFRIMIAVLLSLGLIQAVLAVIFFMVK